MRMLKRCLPVLGIVFGLFTTAAMACSCLGELTGVWTQVNCKGYNISVGAGDLTVGKSYTVKYTLSCGATTVPGTITFTAPSTSIVETVSGSWSLSGDCIGVRVGHADQFWFYGLDDHQQRLLVRHPGLCSPGVSMLHRPAVPCLQCFGTEQQR